MIAAMGEPERLERRPAIIVPVLNDWSSLQRLAQSLAGIPGPRPRLIVVDDGSSEPGPDLKALAGMALGGEILRLRCNFGHQQAIAVGLCHAIAQKAEGPIVIMDGDGEDRPEDVARLLGKLADRPDAVVVAERARRHAPLGFRLFYRLYGATFRALTGRRLGFGNFCALMPATARRLTQMPELNLHLAAAILRSGLPIERLTIDRGKRYDGRSKMNFVALTGHGLRSIAVFGETVLTRIVIAAFLLAALGALVLVIVFAMKLLAIASPGWTTTVTGVILIVVAQIAMTGLLGLFIILRGQRPEPLDAQPAAQALIDRIDRFGAE
jgi:glycosyltransferase involved in cell wall biosynthesis